MRLRQKEVEESGKKECSDGLMVDLVTGNYVSKRNHQEEQERFTQEVEESMLICYLLIAEDRPESLSLFLSPLSLGMSSGVQESTQQRIEQGDMDV